MQAITRARALTLAVSGAALAALRTPAGAQTNPTLRLGVLPVESAAEAHYARDLGYFAQGGLDVTIQAMPNTPDIVAAVVGGALDIGYTTIDSVASIHSHGIPVVVIAPATDYIDPMTLKTAGILVRPDSAIHSAKDLAGKTIALPALHSLGTTAASVWIDKSGGDSSAVKYVEIPFPAEPAALESGRVDAIFEVEPFFGAAGQHNRVLMEGYTAIAKHFLLNLWVAKADWAKAHGDLVSRFAAVIHRTAVWANAHQSDSGAILAKYTKIPEKAIATMVRSHYAEELRADLMQPGIDASAKYNGFASFSASQLLL